MMFMLRIFFDACYLFFEAAVSTVVVFIEMGCCESKDPKENVTSGTSEDNLIETPGPIYGDDEESTDFSTISESSESSISVVNTHKSENKSFLNQDIVETQPISDLTTSLKEEQPSSTVRKTTNKDLFHPLSNNNSSSEEEEQLASAQHSNSLKSDFVSNGKTTSTVLDPKEICCSVEVENVLEQDLNIHDLYSQDKSLKCFENASLQRDLRSKAETSSHTQESACPSEPDVNQIGIVETQLTSDLKTSLKEGQPSSIFHKTNNQELFNPFVNTTCNDVYEEDKLSATFQHSSGIKSDLSNIKTTSTVIPVQVDSKENCCSVEVEKVLKQDINVHDLHSEDKSLKCFENASSPRDLRSKDEASSPVGQAQESAFTSQLNDVHQLGLDFLDFPKEIELLPFLKFDSELVLEHNTKAFFPDVISHFTGNTDELSTQYKNVVKPTFESNATENIDEKKIISFSTNNILAHDIPVRIRRYSDVLRETLKNSPQELTKESESDISIPCDSTEKSMQRQYSSELNKMHKSNSMKDPIEPEPVLNSYLSSSPSATKTEEHSLDAAQASEDQFLSSLAPVCDVFQKEVVCMASDAPEGRKNIDRADKLLYLMIAFTFFTRLTHSLDFEALINCMSYCTEQMKSGLYRISANTLSLKIRIFLTEYNTVFSVTGDIISRKPKAEEWLRRSLLLTLKEVIEDCLKQGQKTLSDLCKILEDLLGSVNIPGLGELLPNNMKVFITNNIKSANIIENNDIVVLAPTMGSSFGVSANQRCLKAVVEYFKNFLKTKTIPYTELSMLLSRDNPHLLEALVERKPEAILALLQKDPAFKYENGLVMLKGFTLAKEVSQQQEAPLNDGSVKSKSLGFCSCCSGIVMSVGKSRATFWCSYSQTCKNIFVIARRSTTVINGSLSENFLQDLCEGSKVVFTTKAESEDGWPIDYAVKVKTVSETARLAPCLCTKKRNMDVFLRTVVISNGIPITNSYTFFWNCKGVVLSINGTKGIVKCMVSELSDKYFLVYFTNRVWFLGSDIANDKNMEGKLTIGMQVELDISLLNYHNTGFLTWFAVCLRKQSNPSPNALWNCSGFVVGVEADRFVIATNSSTYQEKTSNNKYLFAPFQSMYLAEDGSLYTMLTGDMLKMNERIVFDVELNNPCVAKLIRKCNRPSVMKSIVEEDSSIVSAVLKTEMSSDIPVFSTVLEKCPQNKLLFDECKEVQGSYPQSVPQVYLVDSLSRSTTNFSNVSRGAKDSTCQTISTGPIFSVLVPV